MYTIADYHSDCHMFSDMHKDAFGCRPHAVANPTPEQMPVVMEELSRRIAYGSKYERMGYLVAQYNFERSIEFFIRREGMSRVDAVRYIVNRAETRHEDRQYVTTAVLDVDFESACYALGLTFDLEDQLRAQYLGAY